MFGWLGSWWSTEGLTTGPARNAPNNGVGIKQLFDQRSTQVILVDADTIQSTLAGLRRTDTNAHAKVSQDPPLIQEFHDLCKHGLDNFFELGRQRRLARDALQATQARPTLCEMLLGELVSETVAASSAGTVAETDEWWRSECRRQHSDSEADDSEW